MLMYRGRFNLKVKLYQGILDFVNKNLDVIKVG